MARIHCMSRIVYMADVIDGGEFCQLHNKLRWIQGQFCRQKSIERIENSGRRLDCFDFTYVCEQQHMCVDLLS